MILILALIKLILTLPIFTPLALLDFTCKLQFRCEKLLSFDSMVYSCLLRHITQEYGSSALLSKVLIYGIQLSKNTICDSFSIASIFHYLSTTVERETVNFWFATAQHSRVRITLIS